MPRPLIPRRRDRMPDTAEALVFERGFDAMSVQAIAEHVGIAKGAVYREFESKQEILDVLTAARHLDPLTRDDLAEALLAVEYLVAGFEQSTSSYSPVE